MKKIIITGCILLITAMAIRAQNNEWRVRGAVNLNVPLTKKIDLRVSHQRSYEATDRFKNRFNSTGFRLSYELDKKVDVAAGMTFLRNPRNGSNNSKVFARISYETRLGDYFKWKNSLQVETFSKRMSNFKHRVIINSRIGLRERLEFLNLSPSISYSLYYNADGEPVQYYDENKKPAIKQSPDGFHRGRFNVNLSSRINKQFSVSVYYFNQHEFNLLAGDYRRMNIERPNGKISRRFNNYDAAGVTLSFTIGRNGTKPIF